MRKHKCTLGDVSTVSMSSFTELKEQAAMSEKAMYSSAESDDEFQIT